MPRADYGTIELKLGKKEYTMKPTLKAYKKIENHFKNEATGMQGLRLAIEDTSQLSIESTTFVIAAACGIGAREVPELEESIFAEGVAKVAAPVLEYLMKLLNPSGKDIEESEDKESGEE